MKLEFCKPVLHVSPAVALHTPSVQYGLLASRSAQLTGPAFRNEPVGSSMQYGVVVQL